MKYQHGAEKDRDEQIFDQLLGVYKHYCPDWDYMPIDETCPEYEACTCGLEEFEDEKI